MSVSFRGIVRGKGQLIVHGFLDVASSGQREHGSDLTCLHVSYMPSVKG